MWILKGYNDNEGNLKSIDVEMEMGESENYIIGSFKKTNPNIIVNIVPTKIHVNQYDNVYLYKGSFDKTKDIYIPKKRYTKNTTKTILEKSVQCRGFSVEGGRCFNKTKKPNGLCHFHQNPNVSVKYWKN